MMQCPKYSIWGKGLNEPVYETFVANTEMSIRQSIHCLHIQSIEIEEDSIQNSDL